MHSLAFVRRSNPDGSPASPCPKPLNNVIKGASEMALEAAKNLHIGNLPELSDSIPPQTLTERVLMFLENRID